MVEIIDKIKDILSKEEIKKQEIQITNEDKDLLAKLKFRLQESDKLQKDKKSKWENALKFMRGKHWEVAGVKRPSYKSDTIVNKWFAAVRSLVAFETDAKPEPELDARVSPEDPMAEQIHANVKKVEAAIDYRWDVINMPFKLTKILYDRYNFDDGYGMYFWNSEIDDVDFEQIKPKELLRAPGATSVEDAEYLIIRKFRNKKWFEIYYPEEADKIKYEGNRERLSETENVESSEYENMAEVFYYFEDNIWITFTETKILEKIKNPHWEWRSEDEQREELGEMIPQDWQPVRNHFTSPQKPIVHFQGYHLGGQFESESLLDQVISLNNNINKRKCQISDNADAANGQWVIDPSVPKNQVDKITTEPGLKIRVNPTLIRRESGTPLPEFVFMDLEATKMDFDDMMGHHDVSRGASSTKRMTKGEVTMLRETDITPVRLLMRNSEVSIAKILNGWIQLMKLYYDIPHYVGQFGTSTKEGAGQYLTRDEIPINLMLNIKVGSTMPVSRESRRAEYQQWAMAGLMDLKTFYEKMGEPNPEKLANRAMNARMGILSDAPPQPPQLEAPKTG